MSVTETAPARTHGIPRGLSRTGPVLFSYGFRPFFLGGAAWAVVGMTLWIVTVTGFIDVGGSYGAHSWHAHEMTFGFSSAILAGFLLTAVPNWTGRLPVSGWPLAMLFHLWLCGRIALLVPDLFDPWFAVFIDSLFLPTLLFICAREVIAGKKWRDLKVVGGLVALSLANFYFHYEVMGGGHADLGVRLAISAYVVLVTVVGGRMIPSFTHNWLNRSGRTDFPVSYNRFDTTAILVSIVALAQWVFAPSEIWTALSAFMAAGMHMARLVRWRGWTTTPEPIVAVLHVGYLFVPIGFACLGIAALGAFDQVAALHVLNVGTVAGMMLAVMTRATRGHTGRALTSSGMTNLSYVFIFASAIVRPMTAIFEDYGMLVYSLSAVCWIGAFSLYLLEYAPMLARERRKV
jgi:uncharacterized protein involved in response to NO